MLLAVARWYRAGVAPFVLGDGRGFFDAERRGWKMDLLKATKRAETWG